ncbi:MAG: rhomboid family intramembrane serine protease [Candidatus Micrarchaeota archaeon]
MVVFQIIAFTVAVFIANVISGGLINNYFALTPSTFLTQPWTIVTSIFLHGNLMHIFFNMFGLFMFGPYLQAKIGTKNFLYLYFASGIVGNMGYMITSGFGSVPVVGASGAIFGVLGTLAILQPNLMIFVGFIPMPIWMASIFWLITETVYGFGQLQAGVANFAHVFGLFGGLLFGGIFKKQIIAKGGWLHDE